MFGEMRRLSVLWSNEPDVANRLVETNVLASGSRMRAKDVITRAFVPRFVESNPPDMWRIVAQLEGLNADVAVIRTVHYFAMARTEQIIRDFVIEFICPRYERGILEVTTNDVVEFISACPSQKFSGGPWSSGVAVRVARGMLAALRDFGILTGRSKKHISAFEMSPLCFATIAYIIRMKRVSGYQLLHDTEWKIFLLAPASVERLFMECHQRKLLTYHAAGNIIRIDFPGNTMEQYLNAIF